MARMSKFLENDKERFLQRAAAAKDSESMQKVVSDELGRILYAYNDEVKEDRLQACAYGLAQVAGASVAMLDCVDEAKVYKTSAGKAERGRSWWIFAVAAAGLTVSGLLLVKGISLATLLLVAGGVVAMFFSGMHFVSAPKVEGATKTEVRLDGARVYRALYSMAVVMDNVLEDLASDVVIEKRKRIESEIESMPKAQIEMFASLLEEIYAMEPSESKDAMLSSIRYYLHKEEIELEDYTKERADRFDMLPGRGMTMRPALVKDEKLLKKGLASGGR